jgi:glycosyltransferase involved in cell wall biosynthesis
MPDMPLVSVLTPVFNGAEWLPGCIESVQSQTHERVEHVILDNGSTDATRAIAERAAAADGRIRVHANDGKVPLVENWNRAMGLMSPAAEYCWLLPADDQMYPEALAKMLAVAHRNPSAGIVGSLRQRGPIAVQCGGLPEDRELFTGREIGRLFLEQQVFAIAPTTNLVRADLVWGRHPFFPPAFLHTDIAAFLDLLRTCDFGFVHEVLAFSRPHEGSVTATIAEPQATVLRDLLHMLIDYGPSFFDPAELQAVERRHLRRYYRRLLRSYLDGSGGAFRKVHLPALGRAPGPLDLGRAVAEMAVLSVARPRKLVDHLRLRPMPPRR